MICCLIQLMQKLDYTELLLATTSSKQKRFLIADKASLLIYFCTLIVTIRNVKKKLIKR